MTLPAKLSIFSLCSNNTVLKNNVKHVRQRQDHLQGANDEKFFLLGTELAETQKSVHALREVVDHHLNATGEAIRQLSSHLKAFKACMSVNRNFQFLVEKTQNYTSYLDVAFLHLKSFRAAFVSYKTSMYSAVSSLSSGYVPPSFLTPDQLAAIVEDLTDEEIRRGTKLTPAIQVGFEATYYKFKSCWK